jgi:DnaJ-domain-containing protein 1
MVFAYGLMWDLGNQDHKPCGELPEEYQGDPNAYKYNYENFKDDSRWYSDSNFFGNPFEEEKRSYNPFGEEDKYFQVLGLKRSASQEDIKHAFREKARETHPDKGGDEEEFKIVREAYEYLIS